MSMDARLLRTRSASITRRLRSTSWPRRLGILAFSLAGLLSLDAGRKAHAQSLNDEIVRLLDMNCSALLGMRGQPLDPNSFGPNLIAICDVPTTSNGASSGGGSASVQSSTNSIQNSVLQKRLERARRQAGKGAAKSPWLSRGTLQELSLFGTDADQEASGGAGPGMESRRFDLFTSAMYQSLDRNVTDFEDGYDSSVVGATIGADYRFTDKFTGGLLITYAKQDGDFEAGGDFEITSFAPTLYGAIIPTDKTFVQLVLGHNGQDFDVDRDVLFIVEDPNLRVLSGTASSETDGSVLSGGVQFGYDHSVRNCTFGPRVGANYSRTEVDAFVEDGSSGLELRVDDQTVASFQGVAGFYGSMALSAGSGVFLPQINVEWVHEFKDSPDVLHAQFVEDLRGPGAATIDFETNAPDRDFVNVEVGVSAVLAHGIQPYLNIRTMLGNSNFDSIAGTIGVRFEL